MLSSTAIRDALVRSLQRTPATKAILFGSHARGTASKRSDIALLKPFMWDVDIAGVDLHKHRRFVIERLLRFGRPPQVRWVRAHYTEDEIRDVVRKSKVIDRKTASYWSIHLSIPRAEIACFSRQFLNPCFY